jgi:hypothetical protein
MAAAVAIARLMRGTATPPVPASGTSVLEDSARRLNVILPDDLDAFAGASDADNEQETEPVIWPQTQDAISLFAACQTQWRTAFVPGAMIWSGLDYAGVAVAAQGLGLSLPAVFGAVQIMEMAALPILNEART